MERQQWTGISLPIAGDDYMSRFQLKPLPANSGEPTNLYDQNINPTVTNEFATAAFRVGHSLVQGIIELVWFTVVFNFVVDFT